jgi:diguanylate cyclase (GGDEF)-like protein
MRHKHVGAVMFIDLDKFKPVNDELGHDAGDELLKQVAGRLIDSVRDSDTVARLAGDEFCVILPELDDVDDPSIVADKILRDIARPFTLDSATANISCSIGIALFPQDGTSYSELLRKADAAMYDSKVAGRGRFTYVGELSEEE